jgi:hypothetical protein
MKWLARAFIPTMVLLVAGVVVVLGAWAFALRPRRLSSTKAWLALVLVALGFGGWRTWEVWRDFSQPQWRMFRDFVANPIPPEVVGLVPASAAPVMFHDGAYISFHAPPALVQRIVTHSLPGSKTLSVVAEMKQQSARDPADRLVIAAPDGQGYLKVDLDWVAKESSPESDWARAEVENFLKNRQGSAYVLLRSGDWGEFVSVLTHQPASSNVVILQNLERRH